MIKSSLKLLLSKFGYTVSRIPSERTESATHEWGRDPFLDMARLVSDVTHPLVLDVGAHHGHVSRRFRMVIPNSTVLSFEPYPESFNVLQQNVAEDKNIGAFPLGLAERSGNRSFCANEFSATNSLFETDPNGHEVWGPSLLETKDRIDVYFETLEDFASRELQGEIDILKLDCQGAEPLVMRGAARLFREGRVGMVYTEMITLPTYMGQLPFHENIRTFESYGLTLFNLYNLSSTPSGSLRQVDAVFVRS